MYGVVVSGLEWLLGCFIDEINGDWDFLFGGVFFEFLFKYVFKLLVVL